MKSILTTSAAVAMSALIAFSGTYLRADDTNAPGATPQTETKTVQNTPAGPADQGATGTTGTPQQTKTGDTATTDKAQSNGAPNEATKKPKKKKHHKSSSSAASQTNTVPSTTKP
jgi:hypothetical protein